MQRAASHQATGDLGGLIACSRRRGMGGKVARGSDEDRRCLLVTLPGEVLPHGGLQILHHVDASSRSRRPRGWRPPHCRWSSARRFHCAPWPRAPARGVVGKLIKKFCFLNEFRSLDCTAYSKRTDIGCFLYKTSDFENCCAFKVCARRLLHGISVQAGARVDVPARALDYHSCLT
jgi:hypothetical protein